MVYHQIQCLQEIKMRKETGHIGRREFVLKGSQFAIASSVLGSTKWTPSRDGKIQKSGKQEPQFIIDSHIHCGGTEEWVRDMVKIYGSRKVMACVLTWIKDLDLMKNAISSYPDIFIGYGRVSLDDPNAVREIEQFKKEGFVGMKFHTPQKNYDDPSYYQVYRICEEYGLLMIFHTGISSRPLTDKPSYSSSSRMRPMYLDTLCRLCPRATFQGAHLGNPWYEEAAEAARWNPNLYFDVTGSTLLKFIKLNRMYRMKEILWWSSDEGEENPHTLREGPGAWEHIVFGTDEKPTGLEANIMRFQTMLDANNVPLPVQEKMWGLTIARLLKLDPKTRRFIQ